MGKAVGVAEGGPDGLQTRPPMPVGGSIATYLESFRRMVGARDVLLVDIVGHIVERSGQEVVDGDANPATDGVLARVFDTSYNFGSPAVAQLDGDPQLEILAPVNYSTNNEGAIYAFNIKNISTARQQPNN